MKLENIKLHTTILGSHKNYIVLVNRYPIPAPKEPEPFRAYDIILGNRNLRENPEAKQLSFISTYRGESHYKFIHPTLGEVRLRYRYAKEVWRISPNEDSHKIWNYPNRETMEAAVNSAHGLLLVNDGPADELTLQTFQKLTGHTKAKTGFFCHLRNRFTTCKPSKTGTLHNPSYKTWIRKIQLCLEDIKTLTNANLQNQALQLADTLPTCIPEISNQLAKILPK